MKRLFNHSHLSDRTRSPLLPHNGQGALATAVKIIANIWSGRLDEGGREQSASQLGMVVP